MKPAFGYLRVSGKGQLDGDGESRQRASIERFAGNAGFRIIRWFFDGGVSGEVDAEERPRYAEMLSFCGDATTRTVIVESSDRLGRTLVVCETACEAAREAGLTILAADSGMDLTNSDDPARVAMRQMMGVMAQMNKNVLTARLRKGRDRVREQTGRCEGRPGFGERGNPEDDFTLSLIYTMNLARYSLRDIASELNRRRRPAPSGGIFWHFSSVRQVMNRVVRQPINRDAGLLDGLPV